MEVNIQEKRFYRFRENILEGVRGYFYPLKSTLMLAQLARWPMIRCDSGAVSDWGLILTWGRFLGALRLIKMGPDQAFALEMV